MAVREGSRSGAMWRCERTTSSVRGRGRKRERERKLVEGSGARGTSPERRRTRSVRRRFLAASIRSVRRVWVGLRWPLGSCCQVPTWRCRCVWVRAAGVRRMRSGRARRFFREWVGSLLVPIGKRSKCGVFILSSRLNCLNNITFFDLLFRRIAFSNNRSIRSTHFLQLVCLETLRRNVYNIFVFLCLEPFLFLNWQKIC